LTQGAPLVVVGDVLLDRDLDGRVERLAPDACVPVVDDPKERSRPGGAGLAAALAAGDDRPVVLVTALADDAPAGELRGMLSGAGVEIVDVGLAGRTPEKIRIRSAGRPLLRVDRGGPMGTIPGLTDDALDAIASAGGVLVSDYGRGMTSIPGLRDALARLPRRQPVVWDPHPRGSEPVSGARLVTPNRAEARHFSGDVQGESLAEVTALGRALVRRWAAAGVVITLGHDGAILASPDELPLVVPAPSVTGTDPCGAGDRFASAAALALCAGALPSEAVTSAVAAASAFVASGGASTFSVEAVPDSGVTDRAESGTNAGEAEAIIARVRGAGGTIVATGGCFDILHAGHVSLLQGARALGDCLIVCLNADESVRRLKGPDRPVSPAADRRAVLQALAAVDAVVVFPDETPEAVLGRLRPDVWVKGADYSVGELPEAGLLASWGGQAVVLPYLEGRSTTRLLQEVTARVPS